MNYKSPSNLPSIIPVFPLNGVLLLPRTELPLNVFEPRYLAMFDEAMSGDRVIGMIQPVANDKSDKPQLAAIGCAGRITLYNETHDGRVIVTLTGISRFTVEREIDTDSPYRRVAADYQPFEIDFARGFGVDSVNRGALLKVFREFLEANHMTANWNEVEQVETEQLVNTLSLMAPYAAPEKQALLEAADLKTRADVLIALTELALNRQDKAKPSRLQ